MKATALSFLLALGVAPVVAGAPGAPAGPAVPFIADDYGRALAEARARGVPIFIDAWAPW